MFSRSSKVCAMVKHAKWNPVQQGLAQFPTAEEAAYPLLLCKRIAAILLNHAISKGAVQV